MFRCVCPTKRTDTMNSAPVGNYEFLRRRKTGKENVHTVHQGANEIIPWSMRSSRPDLYPCTLNKTLSQSKRTGAQMTLVRQTCQETCLSVPVSPRLGFSHLLKSTTARQSMSVALSAHPTLWYSRLTCKGRRRNQHVALGWAGRSWA